MAPLLGPMAKTALHEQKEGQKTVVDRLASTSQDLFWDFLNSLIPGDLKTGLCVVGGLTVIALILFVVCMCYRRCKRCIS
jgi:hypothetical protein